MADEYIRREDAIDKINERQRKLIYCFGFENDAVKIMDIAKSIIIAIPATDVVPVVRCKDCKHWQHGMIGMGCYWDADYPHWENDFCSRGERRIDI